MALRPISRLLIPNRGEIAARIISTCHELTPPIHTIALYTTSPPDATHAIHADQAVALSSPADFTDVEKLIQIAKDVEADAVHPAYGFLSENPAFARRLTEEGILFVGPNVEVLEATGDKTNARRLAAAANVPVLPALESAVSSLTEAQDFIGRVGFPLMVKALDGGGGRGIRLIENEGALESGFQRAKGESPSGQVFLEKAAVEGYRHVEVQILADKHGEVGHLWERECSLQRRFQKILEVAPATITDRQLIGDVIDSAVRMAKSINYSCLGTFEYLVHESRPEFFFLEVNPRLQVEHTVTEEITSVDLVRLQLALAQGARLSDLNLPSRRSSPAQAPPTSSFQLRITAEDATKNFTLSMGKVTRFHAPTGPGVRVDTPLTGLTPTNVGSSYDSLLAKVVVRAPSFEAARTRAIRALSETRIHGVTTNIPVLLGILVSDDFTRQACSTRWLEANLQSVIDSGSAIYSTFSLRGADLISSTSSASATDAAGLGASTFLFRKGDSFKVTLAAPSSRKEDYLVKLDRVTTNDFPNLVTGDVSVKSSITPHETRYSASLAMSTATAVASSRHRKADAGNPSHIGLPFPGQFVERMVDEGDEVQEDELLCVVRQMKMELEVRSPCKGVVRWVCDCEKDETVDEGTLVAEIERAEGPKEEKKERGLSRL